MQRIYFFILIILLNNIILCFVIGNDFLQHIPFIDAFKLHHVISAYVNALKELKVDELVKEEISKENKKAY